MDYINIYLYFSLVSVIGLVTWYCIIKPETTNKYRLFNSVLFFRHNQSEIKIPSSDEHSLSSYISLESKIDNMLPQGSSLKQLKIDLQNNKRSKVETLKIIKDMIDNIPSNQIFNIIMPK